MSILHPPEPDRSGARSRSTVFLVATPVLVAVAFVTWTTCSERDRQQSNARKARPSPIDVRAVRQAALSRNLGALATKPDADPQQIATTCDAQAQHVGEIEPKYRAMCDAAYYAAAVAAFERGEYEGANLILGKVEGAGDSNPDVPKLRKRIDAKLAIKRAADERERKKAEREHKAAVHAQDVAGRKIFGDALRARYLDAGMDIKVRVSGKDNERITLTFVLFNDVWTHRFQQGAILTDARDLGFRRFTLTDGYDYTRYWTFDQK